MRCFQYFSHHIRIRPFTFIVTFIFSLIPDVNCQFSEGRLIALPVVYYQPETRLAFGAGAVYTYQARNDTTLRKSQLTIGAVYTLNKQFLIYVPFKIYTKNDKYFLSGEIGMFKYFFYYYGIGNQAQFSKEETYNVSFPRIVLNGQKQVLPDMFLGGIIRYDHFLSLSYRKGGLIDTESPTGISGGNTLNIGFTYTIDTRNHILFPTEGHFLNGEVTQSFQGLLSQYTYTRYELNYARYLSFSEKNVIAGNVFVRGRNGEAPFFDLAQLGGNKYLRGFIEGRFRGQMAIGMQAEYRRHVWWRLGVVAFGGIGSVASERDIFSTIHATGGGGIRFLMDKKNKLNVRADYAISKDGGFFYITFGEAF